MKDRLFGFVGAAVLALAGVTFAFGQDETVRSAAGDKWVITAKAGGVNFVQGTVSVARQMGRSGMLLKGDSVEVGDRVSTGADGRAEILLNPGSYLRLAENSAFTFKTTQLEDLQVSILRGSAMLEVFAANDFRVNVTTPSQNFDLIDTGVYRVDVDASGAARLEVWKGKAEVEDSVVKGGRTVSELDGEVAIVKFDRGDRDDFESWSRDRAKQLAKGTKELKDRTLRSSLLNSFNRGRWNMYDSFGLWVYDWRSGRFCFLPFGYGWSSPYGFGFGADIWWYRLPNSVYYYYPRPDRPGQTAAGNQPSGGQTSTNDRPAPQTDRPQPPTEGPRKEPPSRERRRLPDVDRRPPFERMEREGRETAPTIGPIGRSPSSFPTPERAPSMPVSIPTSEMPVPGNPGGARGGSAKGKPIDR